MAAIITKFDEANLVILRNELRRLWDAIGGLQSAQPSAVQASTEEKESDNAAISFISGKLPAAPVEPLTDLTATATFYYIILKWTNPINPTADSIEIWRSESNDRSLATKLATVPIRTDVYWDNLGAAGLTRYYWIRTVSGSAPGIWVPPTDGVYATTGGIPPADIEDFSITASKLFTKIPIVSGDSWTDNSPSAGYVSWNAHNLYYNGEGFAIAAGNTNKKYIYWLNGATSYSSSDTHPTLTDGDFIIATNISGTHDLAWNAIANQVIGSAYIQDAAIINAKIADLAVDAAKIANATITGAKIANATIEEANIANAAITNAKIGNLAVDNAQIANLAVGNNKITGDAVNYEKRQTVYTGSIAVGSLTNGSYYNYVDVTHGLGRYVMITPGVDVTGVINVNYGTQCDAYNLNANTFRVKTCKNVSLGTVHYAYW